MYIKKKIAKPSVVFLNVGETSRAGMFPEACYISHRIQGLHILVRL